MPLCNECLTKENLCNDCSQLSKESVDVSRFLFSMKEQSKSLEDASVKGIVDSDILLIIFYRLLPTLNVVQDISTQID